MVKPGKAIADWRGHKHKGGGHNLQLCRVESGVWPCGEAGEVVGEVDEVWRHRVECGRARCGVRGSRRRVR
jgi:hypothetical protein